jgi:site-specific DNA recombinase
MQLRALGVIRQSKLNEKSSSPARQRAAIEAKAAALGLRLVDIVEDLAVSAFRIPPMERPKIGKWLARPDDFDVLIYFRQDRFVRRLIPDFLKVILWCLEHDKDLFSATEELGDIRKHSQQMMPIMQAWLSQGESEATSARLINMKTDYRTAGRWVGGHPAYGYALVPRAGGGKTCVIDPVSSEIIREAVRRVINGEAVNAIAADLNRRGIPTPRNYERLRAGKPLKTKEGRDTSASVWRHKALGRMLRSKALLGYAVHNGEAELNDSGEPKRIGPPLISETEWDQLQRALDKQARVVHRTQTPSLLLRVAYCALCQSPMYRRQEDRGNYTWAYYRCKKTIHAGEEQEPCRALPVRADWLDAMAEDIFLAEVGHVDITRRNYDQGVDHADEIALVRRALNMVQTEYDAGGYEYIGGQEDYKDRRAKLVGRLRNLSPRQMSEPGYQDVPTGSKFGQAWLDTPETEARRQLMIKAGFRIHVARTAEMTSVMHFLDPELAKRAGLAASGRPVTLPPDQFWVFREDSAAIMSAIAKRTNATGPMLIIGGNTRGN